VANHYATLGVDRGATRREVVQAYRRLVRLHHPDAGGDSARFLEVQAAYDVLGDARQRAQYDLRFAPRMASPPPTPPPAPPPDATHVYRRATAPPPSLPLPSSSACARAIGLGIATFLLPALGGGLVFRTHGHVVVLLFALAAAIACGKGARAIAGTEEERIRRHRQLWMHRFVLPDASDREYADHCARLASTATHCAGFGLTAGVGVVCLLLGALAHG
jgi:curved DNA-binding protein CbpA